MHRIALIAVCLALGTNTSVATEIGPLKKEYFIDELFNYRTTEFYAYRYTRTASNMNGFSVICDMGQAIPDAENESWFKNNPILGLSLELRARAVIAHSYDSDQFFYNVGFVVIVKNGEVMKSFDPPESWFLPWWTQSSTDISISNWKYGTKEDSLKFDLLSGNGFYYKEFSDTP